MAEDQTKAEKAKEEKTEEVSKVIPAGNHKFDDMVKFKAEYPNGYKGNKHMKKGEVYDIHRLHADRLVEKGIGKIV